ncbi:HAD family hydrolase [Dongia sp.]|uniref:HAD family hydrolase n=1 Tax=Dongia sp. TaxID=1977262 RepID=UPI0035AF367C
MTIGAVIFDFGNVLIGWDPENLYRRLIPDAAERGAFLRDICSPAWNLEQDRGRPWAEAIDLLVTEHPRHEPLIRAFYNQWDEMISGPVAEGHDLLRRVAAASIPAYGLTNWSGETYDRTVPNFGFLEHLEYVAVSGHLRMVKPEPEIFHHLLERIAQPPQHCLFIDDNAANIATAERIGLKTIHFQNDGTTLEKARSLGLNV